jgi:hypothetical protein
VCQLAEAELIVVEAEYLFGLAAQNKYSLIMANMVRAQLANQQYINAELELQLKKSELKCAHLNEMIDYDTDKGCG